jgi:hypothetical protein
MKNQNRPKLSSKTSQIFEILYIPPLEKDKPSPTNKIVSTITVNAA